jgi:nitroreductase
LEFAEQKERTVAFLNLVRHRKSVRNFLDKPVEREKIMMCLEAARLAPLHSTAAAKTIRGSPL